MLGSVNDVPARAASRVTKLEGLQQTDCKMVESWHLMFLTSLTSYELTIQTVTVCIPGLRGSRAPNIGGHLCWVNAMLHGVHPPWRFLPTSIVVFASRAPGVKHFKAPFESTRKGCWLCRDAEIPTASQKCHHARDMAPFPSFGLHSRDRLHPLSDALDDTYCSGRIFPVPSWYKLLPRS